MKVDILLGCDFTDFRRPALEEFIPTLHTLSDRDKAGTTIRNGLAIRKCGITSGRRQSCVSLPLFHPVSDLAMRKCRRTIGLADIDLMDGPSLVEIRSADHILMLARSHHEWARE